MVHAKPALPAGHGEVLTRPAFAEWAGLAETNHRTAATWSFDVAGMPVSRVRSLARQEALDAAAGFSARLGVSVKAPGDPEALIVMTGHQPELYHPGVWIKDFLLQRLADETGATAVDLVVDTDGFETVAVSSPCMTPGVARCHQYLAVGSRGCVLRRRECALGRRSPRLLLGRGLHARFVAGTGGSPTLLGVLRAAARGGRRCREPRRVDHDGATALRGCCGERLPRTAAHEAWAHRGMVDVRRGSRTVCGALCSGVQRRARGVQDREQDPLVSAAVP